MNEYIPYKKLQGIRKLIDKISEPSQVTANHQMIYDILNFDPSCVNEHFMISSLCKLNRFLGHTGYRNDQTLSVAQHCVMMAESILLVTGDPVIAMQALWHEGAEPYVGDMISPLKAIMKDHIKPIENNIEKIVFEVLDIPYPMHPLVKHVDINICEYELTFAVHNDHKEASFDYWTADEAYNKFVDMNNRLKVLLKIAKTNTGKLVDVAELNKTSGIVDKIDNGDFEQKNDKNNDLAYLLVAPRDLTSFLLKSIGWEREGLDSGTGVLIVHPNVKKFIQHPTAVTNPDVDVIPNFAELFATIRSVFDDKEIKRLKIIMSTAVEKEIGFMSICDGSMSNGEYIIVKSEYDAIVSMLNAIK